MKNVTYKYGINGLEFTEEKNYYLSNENFNI